MAAKNQVNVLDESRSPIMTILLLAWPVFVEQIFTTLVSFADTAMVGSLGAEATAAISISNTPVFFAERTHHVAGRGHYRAGGPGNGQGRR